MTRRKVAEERRKEIIAGLYACLATKGYQEVTIKDIAKAANVSYGALHYFFESKKDIVFAFVEDFIREEEIRFQNKLAPVESAWERLETMVAVLAEEMILNRTTNKVFLNLHHMGCCDEDIRRCMVHCHCEYRKVIQDAVDYGISRGEFPSTDSERLAFLLVGIVEGVSLQLSIDPDLYDDKSVKMYLFEAAQRLLVSENTVKSLSERRLQHCTGKGG
ncbi:TetR/AcrR family transcriptional regulator [Candidatus Poribacteria bacterium]|nr:TetR/AcrR family transcriptional regulator [Candidatus Poribacteria bacterium]